jgi:phospholipid/cholesterol/gamma-HCH transport system substrate-binding protein
MMAELDQRTANRDLDPEDEIVTVALDRRAWIGITILISFAVTTVFVLMYLLSGGGKDLFQKRVTLRTYFADGSGLEKKAMVELDGVKVGRVSSVELSHSNEPTRVVRVNILLNQRYLSNIPVDSQTEITADNLLGGKYINIHRGVAGEFVKAGDELLAKPPNTDFNPADLIASMAQAIKQINLILDNIQDPRTQVFELVNGEKLYTQIRNDIVALQETVHTIGNPKTQAGKAVFGSDLYEQLRRPIVDIDKQLAAIENGEGTLGHAYASSDQYDTIRTQVADFRKSIAGFRGNKMLTDDQAYVDAVESLRKLNVVISGLSSGPMFDHSQVYESWSGSSKSAEKFLKEFRNNPQKFLRIKVF